MTDERVARRRRSIRLKGYDYTAAGAYFVTIAAQDRECLFGQVVDGEVRLNAAGRMVERQWLALADRFPTVDLDEFVVMPNHFHGIILLEPASHAADPASAVGATLVVARNRAAPDGVARNVVARCGFADPCNRAGMNPAPTEYPAMARAHACDAAPAVGATLVVARNAVASDGVAWSNGNRAGTSPAPTEHPAVNRACDAGPAVGATLVVAQHVVAPDVVARCGLAEPCNRAGTSPAPTANTPDRAPTLGAVVGAFKSISTQAYMDGVRQSGWPPFVGRLWHRNYYEHIIRGEKSLDRIRDYVVSNPQRWAEDRENPAEVDKPTRLGRLPQPWET